MCIIMFSLTNDFAQNLYKSNIEENSKNVTNEEDQISVLL